MLLVNEHSKSSTGYRATHNIMYICSSNYQSSFDADGAMVCHLYIGNMCFIVGEVGAQNCWEQSQISRHITVTSYGCDDVSIHQPGDCLHHRVFRRISEETSKLRVTGICEENSPGTGKFPSQTANNAENVSIRWRHHDMSCVLQPAHSCAQDVFVESRSK